MKIREAIQQAWREMGWTEAQITDAIKHADRNHLQHIQATHSLVKPGCERLLIDELKRIFVKLDALGPTKIGQLAKSEAHKLNQRQ